MCVLCKSSKCRIVLRSLASFICRVSRNAWRIFGSSITFDYIFAVVENTLLGAFEKEALDGISTPLGDRSVDAHAKDISSEEEYEYDSEDCCLVCMSSRVLHL